MLASLCNPGGLVDSVTDSGSGVRGSDPLTYIPLLNRGWGGVGEDGRRTVTSTLMCQCINILLNKYHIFNN